MSISPEPEYPILIGPRVDLHTGAHDSIIDNPPPGICYRRENAWHTFIFAEVGNSPHQSFHWGEFVDFGLGTEVVHSSRWPVLGRRGWVVDTDDFGFPALCGRHGVNPEFRAAFRGNWSTELTWSIRKRVENMVAAYTHPSCKAILFRSQQIKTESTDWLDRLDIAAPLKEAFVAKSQVLYPAQKACEEDIMREKWGGNGPTRVLFCGRDYGTKNGELALRVMGRLLDEVENLECTYIGKIPVQQQEKYRTVLAKIKFFDALPKEEVLGWMARSHIMFHPSKFEGVGIVFLESGAAGMAIAAATGAGMDHMADVVGNDGALLVDRDRVPELEEEQAFESALRKLIIERETAQTMAFRNYERNTKGPLSIHRRNETLKKVYAEASENNKVAGSLSLDQLPHMFQCRLVTMTSDEVRADERAFRSQAGLKDERFIIETFH